MFTESRKTHLVEEVLKTTNESTLVELENVLNKSKKKKSLPTSKPDIYQLLGMMTKSEVKQMKKAIKDTCETIHPDDWK